MEEEKPNYYNIILLSLAFIVIAMVFLGGFGLRSDGYRSFSAFQCPLRDSLLKYHSLTGWDVYRAGGQPLVSTPDSDILELCYIFYLIFNDSNIAVTLCMFVYTFFGIVGMYLLLFRLTNNNRSSVLSCIFLFFLVFYFFAFKEVNRLAPIVMISWIFLLYEGMGDNTRKIILNSAVMGILLSIASMPGGGMAVIVWILFIVPIFLFIDLFALGNSSIPFLFKLKKLILILSIMLIVFSGLAAVKMYPSANFIEKTTRASGFSLQEFIGQKAEIVDFFKLNFLGSPSIDFSVRIGATSLVMIFIGLLLGFKKKNFLKFFIIFMLGIIITTNLFSIARILVLIPVLNKARHIIRFGMILHFFVAVLIGLSFNYMCRFLEKKGLKKWINALFILIVVLLSFEVLYVHAIKNPPFAFKSKFLKSELDKLEPLKYLGAIGGERHRIHMLGKDWVEGGEGEQYFCNLGIETMDWVFGNAWIADYTTFAMWAGSNLEQAAKLWGILNTKYVMAEDPNVIDPVYTKAVFGYKNETDYFVPGLKLIKKFPSCKECAPDITHLYENTRFLPRVFLVNRSILIIGEKDKLYNLYAFMLLNGNFEPRTTVLIGKESIKDEDLSKYSAIILSQQITQEEVQKLKQFRDSGGEIFPDIFINENSVDVEKLDILFQEWNKEADDIKEITEKYYSPDHRIYEIEEDLKGFVVISENFYTYRDEWLATLNLKDKEIYNANFVVSAVYLDGEEGELEFRYNPVYFKRGAIISIITLVCVIILFVLLRKKKNRGDMEDLG